MTITKQKRIQAYLTGVAKRLREHADDIEVHIQNMVDGDITPEAAARRSMHTILWGVPNLYLEDMITLLAYKEEEAPDA